jgi:hypothetical protein
MLEWLIELPHVALDVLPPRSGFWRVDLAHGSPLSETFSRRPSIGANAACR